MKLKYIRNSGPVVLAALVVVLGGIVWSGCEETLSGADVKLPYREELVVQGFLTADGTSDTLLIQRTLPPLEKWSLAKAAVTDATASITVDGTEYPLTHVGTGQYHAVGLRPEVGKTYLLNVRWKNLSVEGRATIPPGPELIGLTMDTVEGGCNYYYGNDEEEFLVDEMRIRLAYVQRGAGLYSARLGLSYSYNGGPPYREEGFSYFLHDIDSSGSTSQATVYSRCLFQEDPGDLEIDTFFVGMTAYEEAFTSYFDTRYNGSDDDLFFGPSGGQPIWNVKGNGFGWFFGRTMREDTIVAE